jgi:thymidylate kinase
MKLIICEGTDVIGKNTLIEGICDHYEYDNIMVRHFAKPPKDLDGKEALDFQMLTFICENNLLKHISERDKEIYSYHESIVIYNRSYLGEYVYGQMFRNISKEELEKKITNFEEYFISNYDPKLVMLTADPSFCLEREDGHSFSQTLEQKTREIELFDEVYDLSSIKDKLKIKVDDLDGFIPKEKILKQVTKFLK